MARFNVVVPLPDGGVEVHPMKEWLRRNPEHIPPGLDPTSSSSHQLRSALKKRGWQVQESPEEVRLLMPGTPDTEAAVSAVLGIPGERESANEDDASFGLEAQLRDFIAQNLARIPINGKRFTLYTNPDGRVGVEYPTAVGPIDILALDAEGNFLVFELKLERGPDRALGQLARYMGWVKVNLARDRAVGGVVVARSIDERLRYAVSVIPTVVLLEYQVEFHVREVAPFHFSRDAG